MEVLAAVTAACQKPYDYSYDNENYQDFALTE